MILPFSGPSADVAVPLLKAAALSVGFALKHYLADFVLQTNWIARGKERDHGWAGPLVVHALCHGTITLVMALAVAPHLWWLAIADVLVHIAIDRSKTAVSHWGRWQPTEAPFWWVLGFDQLLHQVTNIILATALVLL